MSSALKFFINQSASDAGDGLVESFSSPAAAAPMTLTEGDRARAVEIHALVENPAGRQSGGQPFLYDDPAAWDGVRLGAGTIDAPVLTGTFTLTHTGTAETTAAIPYNATAADVQEAIRAGWVVDYSNAVVTGPAGGPWVVRSGVISILNGEITADTASISPVGSVVEVAHTQVGTNFVEDIHELSLVAAPAILRTSGWTALPAAAVAVKTITEGSGTTSEEQRVTWNADAYGGSVRLSLALPHKATITSSSVANPSILTTSEAHGLQTGDSVTISGHAGSTPSLNATYAVTRISETKFSVPVNVTVAGTGGTLSATLTRTVGPLRYDVDEETFAEALAAHPASTATEDSFSVVRNGAGDYTVAFIGALANLAIPEMTATQTLKVPVGLRGTLDCLTSGVRRLLNGSRVPVTTNLEIEKIVGGIPTTIAFRSDLRIRPELLSSTPGSSDPAQIYLTQQSADARYLSGALHHVSLRRSSAPQALSTGAFTRVTFGFADIEYDTGNYFGDATDRLTPGGGYVTIRAVVGLAGEPSSGRHLLTVYKNGVFWQDLDDAGVRSMNILSGTVTDVATGADYYQLYVYTSDSSISVDSAVFQIDQIP